MAFGLVGSFSIASSIATGGNCWRSKKCANNYCASSYVTRALWHKTSKLSKEHCNVISPQNNLKHHFKSIDVRSKCDKCVRKYFMNATSSEVHESEPLTPVSKSISESIKDVMNLGLKLARPYMIITTVLGIFSMSLLAVESLSDLSPTFYIDLLQYSIATLCMVVYQGTLNELADGEIDKTKLSGKPFTLIELFRHTHRHKDLTWLDKRSEHIDAEFTRAMDKATQNASIEGVSDPNEIDVWHDTAGVKRGRIYGLGLESTVVDRRPSYHGSGSYSFAWVRRTEHEVLLKKMQDENSALVDRLDNTEKELQANRQEAQLNNQMLQEMMRRMNFQFTSVQSLVAGDLAQGENGGDDDDGEED